MYLHKNKNKGDNTVDYPNRISFTATQYNVCSISPSVEHFSRLKRLHTNAAIYIHM